MLFADRLFNENYIKCFRKPEIRKYLNPVSTYMNECTFLALQ